MSALSSGQSLRGDIQWLMDESQTTMMLLDNWKESDVKDKLLFRLQENTAMMKLWLELDRKGVFNDPEHNYETEANDLMDYQTGLLYLAYQILDFSQSQRIEFNLILKRYPALSKDLYAALNSPVSMKEAKTLFDRWLYMGLISRYAVR